MDTTPDSFAQDLQEVVVFNAQGSGESNNVRAGPESFGHLSPDKRKETNDQTEERRAFGV